MTFHGICFDYGDSGRCGKECELFQAGTCHNVNEEAMLDVIDDDELDDDEKLELLDLYGY